LRERLLKRMAKVIREQDKLLRVFIERVKAAHPEARVYLIGSRARGDNLPYSDYDVLIILPKVDDRIETITRLRRLKPLGLNLDLLVLEESETRDPLVKKMLEGAKRLA